MKAFFKLLILTAFLLTFSLSTACKKRCGVCQKTITEIAPSGTTTDTIHNIPACGRELDKMNGKTVRENIGTTEPKTVRITQTRCGEKL